MRQLILTLVLLLSGCATQPASCDNILTSCGGAPAVGMFYVPTFSLTLTR
jgi:hypothetical protein